MKKKRVGIIGCGTIGTALAKIILEDFIKDAGLCCVCDHSSEKAAILQKSLRRPVPILDMKTLIKRCDLIIESASVQAASEAIPAAAKFNKEILVMSVGGLLKPEVFKLIRQKKLKLWVPSGALCGVDGLLAAKESKIKSVRLVTRKPPQGLQQAPYFKNRKFPELKKGKEYCIFKGVAEEAVRLFPQNVNVAAILSLAGIGSRRTEVEIWTSMDYLRNQHEVTVEGGFGKFRTVTENVPSYENPKTSALAIYSAIATLRRIFSPVRVGT